MSYNLLNGGRDNGSDERWRTAAEVINDAAPDVLVVQEARGFDADGGRYLYAAEHDLGMRGLLALAPSTGQHTAVFFKTEIRPLRFDPDADHFHHALAQVMLLVPGFDQPVTIASMHLSPFSPALRAAEVGWLAGLAAPDLYTVIAGDANSLAPGDPEPAWERLPTHLRVRHLQPAAQGQAPAADRSTLAYLHAAGFIDAAAAQGQTATPTVPSAGFPKAEFVPFRSDHALLSPRLAPALTNYRVIDDARTATASDHLPFVIELDPDTVR
ncbi:endonuclease/exonuclease/phosphatase family protein [Promicromonospora sp. NPDC057138]|uniref:endonuclease/exonuclease/phosphatase family protein n=1 Tax=Promicromonospora sp. NPDC057138 TaxID=3346031 RepID=UPI003639164B